MRRVYKQPEQVEPSLLLDYLVMLAISGRNFSEFEAKSVVFIERALELVEDRFTGTENIKSSKTNKTAIVGSKDTLTELNTTDKDALDL